MTDKKCGATCSDGSECEAWAMANGRCRHHGGKSTGPTSAEGKETVSKNRVEHGLYGVMNDPAGMYDLMLEIEGEEAGEWIQWKASEYADHVPFEVFELEPDPSDTHDELTAKLTGRGEDILHTATKIFMTRRGQKRAIAQGIVKQVEKVKGNETVKVEDVNPVMQALDMLERQVDRELKRHGITDTPESQQADATQTIADVMQDELSE